MLQRISIVIPNFNGKELLKNNIPSLLKALLTSNLKEYEIIVADDASQDDSVEFLKSTYPEIIIIESKKNCGFAGNINKGIFLAKFELVFLLNSDVKLTAGYFSPLLPFFENPNTFGVMGKITGLGTDKIQDAAKLPAHSFGRIDATKNYIDASKSSFPTFFLSGANALVDRKKLIQLNGFQELFNPYYFEDVDLGIRAWRLGYSCYYYSDAVCEHPISSTIKKQPSDKVKIIINKNKIALHFFHLSNIEWYLFFISTFLKSILRLLFFDFKNLKGLIIFLKTYNKFKTEKQKFIALQKSVNCKYTLSDIVTKIEKEIPTSRIIF